MPTAQTTLSASDLTIAQIRALRDEAHLAGDPITADMCQIAIDNEDSDGTGTTLGTPCTVERARAEIARVINDARAMEDDPLQGFSPDEIVVGPGGQTLDDAADSACDHDDQSTDSDQ